MLSRIEFYISNNGGERDGFMSIGQEKIDLEVKNLSFYYEGNNYPSLQDINLKVKAGECVVLLGKSGCGKSTLTRLFNGLIPYFFQGRYQGIVKIKGEYVLETELYQISQWVGSVFQDPRSQFFTMNTTDEIAFGCENLGLSSATINQRVERAFSTFQMDQLKGKSIFKLSSGEKQKIALASAYAMNPDIVILDEPSANLDNGAIDEFEVMLKKLKHEGKTIVISEHRLYYLKNIADRFIYIEDGKIDKVWTRKEFAGLKEKDLIEFGLRSKDKTDLFIDKKDDGIKHEELNAYELRGVEIAYDRKNILGKASGKYTYGAGGKIIGIIGENGAGKTTLAKVLSGLLKIKKGQVIINGKQEKTLNLLKKSYFLMQDSDYQLFSESVEKELKFGCKDKFNQDELEIIDNLGIGSLLDRHPMSLSGGQKQRVCIACAILSQAEILFFDEPTSGLDGKNMRNLQEIMINLKEKGKLIFIITHDNEFIKTIADELFFAFEKEGTSIIGQ